MNFLAHLYLSGDDPEILTGNFIGDGVKGKAYLRYPKNIAKGVLLHRAIDGHTDDHPKVMEGKDLLWPMYGKFSGIILDVFYDHFLACQWKVFSRLPLEIFVDDSHRLLKGYESIMPGRIRKMFPYLVEQQWLLNYGKVEGIERALKGLSRRFPFENPLSSAGKELNGEHRYALEKGFMDFFPDLIRFSEAKRKELQSTSIKD